MRSKAAEKLDQILTEHPEMIPFVWEAVTTLLAMPNATTAEMEQAIIDIRAKYGY